MHPSSTTKSHLRRRAPLTKAALLLCLLSESSAFAPIVNNRQQQQQLHISRTSSITPSPVILAAETTNGLTKVFGLTSFTNSKNKGDQSVDKTVSSNASIDAIDDDSSIIPNSLLQFVQDQDETYVKGFLTIAFICFLNASSNPLWHSAVGGTHGPPALAVNAAIAVTALLGLVAGRPLLEEDPTPTMLAAAASDRKVLGVLPEQVYGGMELGFWKFLGTSAHVVGLSLTSSDHGAFLIQLTTLMVPVIQGLRGEKIPRQIQAAVALAMVGVAAFTQDGGADAATAAMQAQVLQGDLFCVAAAFFYSLYDIQTFKWGSQVPRAQLVTTKVATQATLSIGLLAALAWPETMAYMDTGPSLSTLIPVILYSGLVVNALATFLQVKGMVAVGPVRAQLIFASQPLWSSGLAYLFLHETVGAQGAAGGLAFFAALYLAATAPQGEEEEEVAA